MPDRETVIANIREDIDLLTHNRQPTTDELRIINDMSAAVVLLKEQEAVEPKHNPLSPTDWFCGKCGMCISRFHDYCPSCGQEVKWE